MTSRKTSYNGARSSRRTSPGGGRVVVASARKRPSHSSSAGRRTPARKVAATGKAKPRTASPSRRLHLVPLTLVVILIAAAWSYYPVARMHYQEQREKARLESELAGLRERNSQLREQVDRLKTPEGVEEVARESLGLVKEGENLYVVLDGDETATAPAAAPATPQLSLQQAGMWSRMLDALFGFEE